MIYKYSAVEYIDSKRLNQSTLKDVIDGMDSFLAKVAKKEAEDDSNVEKKHFVKGSLVDTLLTGTTEQFEKEYHISTLADKPSDKEMMMCKDMVDLYSELKDHFTKKLEEEFDKERKTILQTTLNGLCISDEIILKVIDQHGWQPKWKTDTRIEKIKTTCAEYLQELMISLGKQIITISEYDLAKAIVASLKTNINTAQYFDGRYEEDVHVDIHFQLPIYFDMDGTECKALLDMVVVILDSDGIVLSIQPFDIKTVADYTINFPKNLKRFRYDIQAAWYLEALTKSYRECFSYEHYSEDFHFLPFTFIVESTIKPGTPLLFVATDDLIKIGRYGRKPVFVNQVIDDFDEVNSSDISIVSPGIIGFESLLRKYNYYVETEWKCEKVIEDTNGVLSVNWNGIVYPIK